MIRELTGATRLRLGRSALLMPVMVLQVEERSTYVDDSDGWAMECDRLRWRDARPGEVPADPELDARSVNGKTRAPPPVMGGSK